MSKVANIEKQVEMAKKLYAYQNYRSKFIPQKVKSDFYQKGTIVSYHALLRKYLKTGIKDLKRVSNAFYDAIDNAKATYAAILRPNKLEEAPNYSPKKSYKRRKSSAMKVTKAEPKKEYNINSAKINISEDTLKYLKTNSSVIYGLQLDTNLKMFSSKEEREGYTMAYKEIDPSIEFKYVKLTVEEE